MSDFDNSSNIIDSRAIIERLEELRESPDSELSDDEREELHILTALESEADGSPDWAHGETLIRDSYFEHYAQELAEDCGMISGGEKWPLNCIDWERAARELQQDYSTVDYGGVTYWIRS